MSYETRNGVVTSSDMAREFNERQHGGEGWPFDKEFASDLDLLATLSTSRMDVYVDDENDRFVVVSDRDGEPGLWAVEIPRSEMATNAARA